MIPFFHKPQIPLIENYLAAVKSKLSRQEPAKAMRFVALDTETSGFDVATDRILSIALFEIVDGKIDIGRSRKWIVFQSGITPTSATAIHGILPSETREGTQERKVLEELLPLLSGAIVVGHHIRFDAAMLNAAMLRHFKTKFRNRLIDTAAMAMSELIAFRQTGYANQRPPSLDEVCSQLNLPIVARHTAEGDAFLAAQIFLLLGGRIRSRKNRPLQLRDLPVTRFGL